MFLIVIVCYRSAIPVAECLKHIAENQSGASYSIVLVNNSTEDASEIEEIGGRFGARTIQNDKNVGYGAACNIGAESGDHETFVFFVNPDVRLPSGALSRIAEVAAANPDFVALAPLQAGANGRIRVRRYALGQKRRFGGVFSGGKAALPLLETGFISGGALAVTRAAFEKVGGFDDRIFLFHEDDDLCIRLAREGRLGYIADLVATHRYGTSSPRSDALTRLRAWHLGHSRIYVMGKHYGPHAAKQAKRHAFWKFASPEMLTSRGRLKAKAFWDGTKAALVNSSR